RCGRRNCRPQTPPKFPNTNCPTNEAAGSERVRPPHALNRQPLFLAPASATRRPIAEHICDAERRRRAQQAQLHHLVAPMPRRVDRTHDEHPPPAGSERQIRSTKSSAV